MDIAPTIAIKICGIKTEDALEAAIEAGAYYVGLVFFAKSPRHLDMQTAARLAAQARGRIKTVALLVDPDDAALDAIARAVNPDLFQLHGQETPARVSDIRSRWGRPVIKAIRVGTAADVSAASAFAAAADLILFDAKTDAAHPSGLPGGTGTCFDWRLIAAWKGRRDFMLSGGLNPDNVRAAIEETGAPAVDVSSGVETAPGVKSADLIRSFVAAAKGALVPAE